MSESSIDGSEIRYELGITKVLTEGCLPVLSSAGAGPGENFGPFLQRQVKPPVIQTRFSLRNLRDDSQDVPEEVMGAMSRYAAAVGEEFDHLLEDSPLALPLPQWSADGEYFLWNTQQAYESELNLLLSAVESIQMDDTLPCTCRVHSVDSFFQAAAAAVGVLLGSNRPPIITEEYTKKLDMAVASVKGVDDLCATSSDAVKIAFTTGLDKPTRLTRTSFSSDEMGNPEIMTDWRVMSPQAFVGVHFMDDCPQWIHRNEEVQGSYSRTITQAVDYDLLLVNEDSAVDLRPETTAEDFVRDTEIHEDRVFSEAAYTIASHLSTTMSGRGQGEVKIAWVNSPMFKVLAGQQSQREQSYCQKYAEYQRSIEECLETMRGGAENGAAEGDDDPSFDRQTMPVTWPAPSIS